MEQDVVKQLVAGLFAWTLASMGAAVVGLYAKPREYWHAFWFMTGIWALVDGILAWFGLVNRPGPLADLSRLLLINAGLDVVYLAAAVFLMTRKGAMLRGFGLAVAIQGGFLLLFDIGFHLRCEAILAAG
ncbi:MAG: hypothetical protein SFX72_23060 [Isosphaeraceae bacterium]|nr:hypothetical protein [Isosphaeraceae bacterium]